MLVPERREGAPRFADWRLEYRDAAMGPDVVEYLRHKTKRLTAKSYRGYERTLAMLAVEYPDTPLIEFEPPRGTALLEDFLANHWVDANPKTYNTQLSVLRDFFKWNALRWRLQGDPTLPIERGKQRMYHRTTLSRDQRDAILEATRNVRYRLAVRLLLDYGLRKGALANVQLEHFDRGRERLTIFTKGEKIQVVPIPDPDFWAELAELEADPGCQPHHFLMCKHHVRRTRRLADALLDELRENLDTARATLAKIEALEAEGATPLLVAGLLNLDALSRRTGLIGEKLFGLDPEQPLGEHALHSWWYRRLAGAGIVLPGTTRGRRMHSARHSAAQHLLDTSGDILATKELLGHTNVATTQTYVNRDTDGLAESLKKALAR